MKYVGYHRTSTTDQHLEKGVHAIEKYCNENRIALYKNKVYTDQKTGLNFNRPAYLIVKEELLETGDSLIVAEVDRLGRNKEDTLKELRYFKDNGIRVMILELPTTLMDFSKLDNSMAAMILDTVNNMLIEMYTTFAQAEIEKLKKRQREGIEEMKLRGEWNKYGRPRAMENEQFYEQYQRVLNGEIRPYQLMEELEITKPTYYRYRKEYEQKQPKIDYELLENQEKSLNKEGENKDE